MSTAEATFSLLDEEEERDEVGPSTTIKAGRPSLRSISLSQAPSAPRDLENGQTSCAELHKMAAGSTTSLTSQSKNAKKVNKFYKKQNELLENFKNDSEQIEQFNRTRRRTTSKEEDDDAEVVAVIPPAIPEDRAVVAPLVKHVDGTDEPEVVIFDVPRSPRNPRRKPMERVDTEEKSVDEKKDDESSAAARMAKITLAVNFLLMVAKVVASVLSGSMSIISSMVDSVVDITSGLVISLSERMIKKRDPYLYPRGRTRLEPLALILISVIMGMASVQLIISSVRGIHDGIQYDLYGIGEEPKLNVTIVSVVIMVSTVLIKLSLYLFCKKYKDPSVNVLAMDHRNDCISNTVALLCAWLGTKYSYYFDPAGAIIVSLYILYTWVQTGREHLAKLSGKTAEPEFINRIIKVCLDHDNRISHIDTVYVYHFGSKFLVEVHIVLDENMILRESHDISETLQSNIESLPEVERAFVHTDYDYDHHPHDEHKVV
uniref:ZT_dimer domain-containing protein n=1 Tax=Caenorhabditis tropicalis TaxID=1561998 RepID=A0A1I7UQW3_9PELO